MTIQLSSLRVAADLDPGGFVRGANAMASAQQQLVGGNRMVAVAMADLSGKVSQAGDPVTRLSRQFIEGFTATQRFEGGLRSLGRSIETGKVEAGQAEAIYAGMSTKLGLVANGADIAAQGFGRLGAIVSSVNERIGAQTTMAVRNTEALSRMAVAKDNAGSAGSSFRQQNLGFQLQDIGVSLYGGMPITTVLIQQGSQIAGIYGGAGGVNALMKDFGAILGAVARYAGPAVAAGAALYGGYKLLASYSLEAALAVDKETAALAAQAAPLGALQSQIGELAHLQDTYQKAITTTASASDLATASIIANTEREYNAKKSLLELEVKRQDAAIAAQRSELAIAGLGLRRDLGGGADGYGGLFGSNGVSTRMDLERQGFADPRINSGMPFVRLPDDITGLSRTQELLDKNPLNDRIKELRANLQLTEIGAQKLREALKQTFQDAGGVGGPTFAGGNIPIPHFRGVDDMPLSVEVGNDLLKSGKARVLQMQQERDGLGLLGGAAAAYRFEMDAMNAATARNVELGPDQIANIKAQAAAYGLVVEQIARANMARDLQFERDQQFRSAQDQQIASRQHGANLQVDLNSTDAQQMRDLARFADAKGLAVGFLTDFKTEMLRNGGNVGKALGESILNALTKSMDDQLGRLFDRFATWLASELTGQQPGGGTPGIASAGATIAKSLLNDNTVTRSPLAPVGAGGALSMVGNYKGGVDPRLTDILNTAAKNFPGYKVDAISGFRAGDPRFHGRGLATDVNLTDLASGKSLANYQNADSFRTYEKFAQTARQVQLEKYPELTDRFRWGGYFGGARGKYGAMDEMHFDLGGGRLGMAGGSWRNGLNDNQRALFPGAESFGIGSSATKASEALAKLSTGATQTAQSLTSGLGHLGQSLSQFPAAPTMAGGAGGGLWSMLGNLFHATSPYALRDIASGSWGLFADGTENAPAGWAWVGERGPELRKLRAGDVIRSNPRSMGMAANAGSGGDGVQRAGPTKIELHTHVYGGSGDDHIRMLSKQGAQEAIGEYHQAQERGGIGEMQRKYASQKG